MLKCVEHIGMTVPDMEQATDFFKNVFNAKIAFTNLKKSDKPLSGEKFTKEVGVEPDTIARELRVLTINNTMNLELFCYETKNKQREPLIASDIGLTHVAFYVEDIEKISELIIENGGELFTPICKLNGESEENSGNYVYCKTPWGLIIELINYDADKLKYSDDSETLRFTPNK